MCRFIVHTMAEIPDEICKQIQVLLARIAVRDLGSLPKGVEVIWPMEKLGLNAPKMTIDAEFTVGSEEGDIPPEREVFKKFARKLLIFLRMSPLLEPFLKPNDPIAVWVKPHEKSVWLAASR